MRYTWNDTEINEDCHRKSCGFAPKVANATLRDSNITLKYMDIVTYECYDGFKTVGDPKVSCLETGLLSKVPICEFTGNRLRGSNK